jgi:hypothetical protein
MVAGSGIRPADGVRRLTGRVRVWSRGVKPLEGCGGTNNRPHPLSERARQSTVHADILAGEVAGIFREEECDRARHLLWV